MRLRDMPIKWKVIAAIVTVNLVALLAAGTLFFAYEYWAVEAQMRRDLETVSSIIASNSTAALDFEDATAAEETLASLAAKPAIEEACIYDLKGRIFAKYRLDGNDNDFPATPPEDGLSKSGDTLDYALPIQTKAGRIGTLFVRAQPSELKQRMQAFVWGALAILLTAALLGAVLSSILQRRLLAPILALAETARQVSANNDFSLRAVKHGQDETGVLIDSFNQMLAQIQTRDLALEDARQELERRVEERTRELKEANKELESFSYSVAHDLRAPLRGIDGFTQIISEEYADKFDETGHRYMQRVLESTKRMGELIDDILNLAKVSRASLHRDPIDLSEISNEVIARLRDEGGDRNVQLEVEASLPVVADRNLMKIVLTNLIGNAWKFTGRKVDPKIEVGKLTSSAKEAYFVRDNGAGFDMAYANKLFGVFQRLHTESEFPGTGVGLVTVQRIISRHGGEIWAEGEVEKGATFYFTLPDPS